jgi:NAD(P)-dependent dehydrogenase (short-subunit alcohol dehydrogenase family)
MTVGPRLEGKVALLSGGASGIGAETARLFAEHGAAVAITDVNDTDGAALADEINAAGGRAFYRRLDVTQEAEWEATVAATLEAFGSLTVLGNFAGIGERDPETGKLVKIHEASLAEWNRVMDINMTGTFLGTKHAIQPMRDAGGGSIINISSMYGIVGSTYGAAYHASKGAVRTFTKGAALQYAPDQIRVNSVHPGFVMTPLTEDLLNNPKIGGDRLGKTPLGRFGTARDIANGCLYLASDETAWMTGSELVIDGGWMAE